VQSAAASEGSLSVGCPRCPIPVLEADGAWWCPEHGAVPPLRRPSVSSYDGFVEHLSAAGSFPTYLPWPLSPGWRVTDFGVVGADPERAVATVACCAGVSELDGTVDVTVVSEEPGTGLGARCAGTPGADPGPEVGDGPATVHVRIGGHEVAMWAVSMSATDQNFDRTVLVGEADGRWLWLVLRPASAILLLRADWILRDVSGIGPPLVELPFGGPPPSW